MKGPTIVHIPLVQGMDQSFGEDSTVAPAGTLNEVTNLRANAAGHLEKRWGMAGLVGNSATGTASFYQFKGDGIGQLQNAPAFVDRKGGTPVIGTEDGIIFAAHNPTGYDSNMFSLGDFSTAEPLGLKSIVGQDRNTPSGVFTDMPGIALTSSHRCVTHADSNLLRVSVSALDGHEVFQHQGSIAGVGVDVRSGVTRTRVVAVGENFNVFYQQGGTVLRSYPIVVGQNGIAGTTDRIVATLVNPAAYWDVSSYNDTTCCLALQESPTTLGLKILGVYPPITIGTGTIAVDGSSGNVPVSIWGDSSVGRIVVGSVDSPRANGVVQIHTFNPSLTVVGAPVVIYTGIANGLPGAPLVGRGHLPIGDNLSSQRMFCAFPVVQQVAPFRAMMGIAFPPPTGTVAGSAYPGFIADCVPISKPDDRQRLWAWMESGNPTGAAFARAALLRFRSARGDFNAPWSAVKGLGIELTYPEQEKGGRDGPLNPTGVFGYFGEIGKTHPTAPAVESFTVPLVQPKPSGVFLDFGVVDNVLQEVIKSHRPVRHADSLLTVGQPMHVGAVSAAESGDSGFPLSSTSQNAHSAELGFISRPVVNVQSVSSGSGAIAAGTYSYRVLARAIIGKNKQLSGLSPPVAAVVGVNGSSVTLAIEPISVSMIRGTARGTAVGSLALNLLPIDLDVYRTRGGGSQYQYAGSIKNLNAYPADECLTRLIFVDNKSDEQISTQEFVYTDGGVIENTIAPACRFMVASEERLWCGGLWLPEVIQASKIFIPGEQVAFAEHGAFQVVLPEACTGLAYQDGNIVAFSETNIYVVGGDGPNDQGIGGFSPPRKITSGVGCLNHLSIRETNRGIIFQSKQGFYLLPRGFGPVEYIGAAVRGLVQGSGLSRCIASAVLAKSEHHEARFLMTQPTGTSSRDVLTYDIDGGRWFHDTLPAGREMWGLGAWPDGFAMCQAALTTATTHPIWHERVDELGDQAQVGTPTASRRYVDSVIKTNRIYPFGSAGWGQINKVLVAAKPVGKMQKMTVTAQVDDYPLQTAVWTMPASGTVEYRQMDLINRQGTSIQVLLRDDDGGAGPSKGLRYLSLSLEVSQEEGARLLRASEMQ